MQNQLDDCKNVANGEDMLLKIELFIIIRR